MTARGLQRRMPSVMDWTPTDPLRAQGVLRTCGISLRDLERETTRALSTWSRMLSGTRPLHVTDDDKARVEALILAANPDLVTDDLWLPAPPVEEPATPSSKRPIMLQRQELNDDARQAWGLFINPFDEDAIIVDERRRETRLDQAYLTREHEAILGALVTAVTRAGMVALSGPSGSGKSTLRHLSILCATRIRLGRVLVLEPANIERRRLTSGHLADEIIRQLGTPEDRTPSNANRRDAQAAQVLARKYAEGYRTVLVIDEAHELPTPFLHDLKRWAELRDESFGRLLGILLFGHPQLGGRLAPSGHVAELSQRMQVIDLPPMRGHVAPYMARRFEWVGGELSRVFAEDALRAMEARLDEHGQQHPLLIGNLATASMNEAYRVGLDRVNADCVHGALKVAGHPLARGSGR